MLTYETKTIILWELQPLCKKISEQLSNFLYTVLPISTLSLFMHCQLTTGQYIIL